MPTGSRYAETRNLTRNELCAVIRATMKDLVAKGALPKARYTLRKDEYAGGWHLYVTVAGLPFPAADEEYFYRDAGGNTPTDRRAHRVLTPAAAKVQTTLEDMLASFNYDNSDPQTDYFNVRFYSDVTIQRYSVERRQLYENVEKLDTAFPTKWRELLAEQPLDAIRAAVVRAGGVDYPMPKLPAAIPEDSRPGVVRGADDMSPEDAERARALEASLAAVRDHQKQVRSDAARKAWATRRARENGNEPGPDINPETGERWGGDINAAWDDVKHGPAPRD